MAAHTWLGALAALALLAGCAAQRIEREAQSQARRGDYEAALRTLDAGVERFADNADLRRARLRLRERAQSKFLEAAARARQEGKPDEARQAAQRLLAIDPDNALARTLLDDMARDAQAAQVAAQVQALAQAGKLREAQAALDVAQATYPRDEQLRALARDWASRLAGPTDEAAALADTRPVSLEFRNAPVRMIVDALSQATGVNFIIDKDVRQDQSATLFLKRTSLENALRVLARSNQLALRVLGPTTVLIYPNTPDKVKEYQDLLIRGFYLAHADAEQTANLLRSLLKLRDVFVDSKLNLLVVRDSPEAVRLAERLVAMHDIPEPEVMLEVEVLEVKSTRLTELGVKYPDSFGLTPLGASSGSSSGSAALTVSDLENLNRSRIGVSVPDVLINLKRDVTDFNTLANPRIRARNREKARILIGDRVPVVTSSTGTGFVSQNVQYLDVGLKLEVEPSIHFDDGVAIKVGLEVSSITREVNTGGVLAYQIGTRTANTTLRLQDGETQLLAGLISKEDRASASRIPGLGDLPILGRLFANQRDDAQRTEIVLSITPRLVRAARAPRADRVQFWSGTESSLQLAPLSLAQDGREAAAPARSQDKAPSASAQAATDQTAAPQTPADESAQPPNALRLRGPAQANVGDVFEVAVHLSAQQALQALPLELRFDPALLKVLEVLPGTALSQGHRAEFMQQVLPQDGRVVMAVQSRDAQGLRGDEAALVIVRLSALKAGQTRLDLRQGSALGLEGGLVELASDPGLDLRIDEAP